METLKKLEKLEKPRPAERVRLADERGLYPDGSPGEIFLRLDKQGSLLSGFADSLAIAVSIALQHGVPLSAFTTKLKHMEFEPKGVTSRPDIRALAQSLVDYLSYWLDHKFDA